MVKKSIALLIFILPININAQSTPVLENEAVYGPKEAKKELNEEFNNRFYVDYLDASTRNNAKFSSVPNKISDQIIISPSGISKLELSSDWLKTGYDSDNMSDIYSISGDLNNSYVTFKDAGLVYEDNKYEFVDIVITFVSNAPYNEKEPYQVDFKLKNKIYQNGDYRIRHYESFQITTKNILDLKLNIKFKYSENYSSKQKSGKLIEGESASIIFDNISNAGSVNIDKEEIDYTIVNDCFYEYNFETFGKCEQFNYDVQTREYFQVNKDIYQNGIEQKNAAKVKIDNHRIKFYEKDSYVGFMDSWFWPYETNYFSLIDQNTNARVQLGMKSSDFDIHLVNQYKWFEYEKNKVPDTTYTFSSPKNSILLTRPKINASEEQTVLQIPIYNYGGLQTPLNISLKYANKFDLDSEDVEIISIDQREYFEYLKTNNKIENTATIKELKTNSEFKTLKNWDINRDYYIYNTLFSDKIVFNRVILENQVAIIEIKIDETDKFDYKMCSGFLNCSKQSANN